MILGLSEVLSHVHLGADPGEDEDHERNHKALAAYGALGEPLLVSALARLAEETKLKTRRGRAAVRMAAFAPTSDDAVDAAVPILIEALDSAKTIRPTCSRS